MRCKVYIQDVKNHTDTTGFSRHTLSTGHEYGSIRHHEDTLDHKGPVMNSLENFHIRKITDQNMQLNDILTDMHNLDLMY
jgi:hypothetical protein